MSSNQPQANSHRDLSRNPLNLSHFSLNDRAFCKHFDIRPVLESLSYQPGKKEGLVSGQLKHLTEGPQDELVLIDSQGTVYPSSPFSQLKLCDVELSLKPEGEVLMRERQIHVIDRSLARLLHDGQVTGFVVGVGPNSKGAILTSLIRGIRS